MDNLSLYRELERLLRMDSRWCTEDGVLMRNAVVEAALAVDPGLVGLLMEHDGLRRNFFTEVGGVMVFDKVRFQRFVSSKSFLPNSYTAYKNTTVELAIDDGSSVAAGREVVLAWPHKDCLLEGGQTREEARRQETFWSEVLAPDDINRLTEPKVLTAWQRHDSSGAHAVDAISPNDNLIIKGNNLLALHSLKRIYGGRVKLIYIDPPFNTGNDSFGYNDSFKHSTWLTFMKNRLEVARQLLSEDGSVICVQCDDNECARLKVMMDEIFGVVNHVTTVVVKSSTPSGLKTAHRGKTLIKTKDYIHIYKKGQIWVSPQYIQRAEWDSHYSNYLNRDQMKVSGLVDVLITNGILPAGSKLKDVSMTNSKFRQFYKSHQDEIFRFQPIMPEVHKKESQKHPNEIYRYSGADGEYNYAMNGRRFSFISESINVLENGEEDLGLLLCDLWTDIDFQNTQNEGGVDFPSGKKPERLLLRLMKLFTDEGDLVLDYHLGSGTTAAVAHKMKRRYIGIEQMDYIKSLAVKRLENVIKGEQSGISKITGWQGGGSFVYCELASLNQRFADEILAAGDHGRLHDIWAKMQQTGFLSWNVKPDEINANAKAFDDLGLEDARRFLIECLDKNLLYVPMSEIGNVEYGITDEDKRLNNQFYSSRR